MQSFLVVSGALTTILTSGLVVFVIRPLTLGVIDYLPAGPTPLVFAILAQYHGMVPHLYRYRLATTSAVGAPPEDFKGLTFSDKSYRYALAVQLALFQWPGSLLGALVGWVVGHAWRNDLLPGKLTAWRIPGWMLGLRTQKRSEEFEGLRRRLEGEGGAGAGGVSATSSGLQSRAGAGGTARRRGMAQQFLDQFRGAF